MCVQAAVSIFIPPRLSSLSPRRALMIGAPRQAPCRRQPCFCGMRMAGQHLVVSLALVALMHLFDFKLLQLPTGACSAPRGCSSTAAAVPALVLRCCFRCVSPTCACRADPLATVVRKCSRRAWRANLERDATTALLCMLCGTPIAARHLHLPRAARPRAASVRRRLRRRPVPCIPHGLLQPQGLRPVVPLQTRLRPAAPRPAGVAGLRRAGLPNHVCGGRSGGRGSGREGVLGGGCRPRATRLRPIRAWRASGQRPRLPPRLLVPVVGAGVGRAPGPPPALREPMLGRGRVCRAHARLASGSLPACRASRHDGLPEAPLKPAAWQCRFLIPGSVVTTSGPRPPHYQGVLYRSSKKTVAGITTHLFVAVFYRNTSMVGVGRVVGRAARRAGPHALILRARCPCAHAG